MTTQKDDTIYPLTEARNLRHQWLVVMAPAFHTAKYTAADAAQFIAATGDLLERSKKERPDGGMEAFWELVYVTPGLPVALIERLVTEAFRTTTYRELLRKKFAELADLIMDTETTTVLYREWLKLYFAGEAKKKEATREKIDHWKTKGLAWPEGSK